MKVLCKIYMNQESFSNNSQILILKHEEFYLKTYKNVNIIIMLISLANRKTFFNHENNFVIIILS